MLFCIYIKNGTMTDSAGQSFPGHTRCRVAIDTGALGKVLMIVLLYAARISEGKRFPLSLSLSKECGSSCTQRYDHVWVIGCVLGALIAHTLLRRWAWARRGNRR